MDKLLFDDIVSSLNEAIAITKGETAPSRVSGMNAQTLKPSEAKQGYHRCNLPKSSTSAQRPYKTGSKAQDDPRTLPLP